MCEFGLNGHQMWRFLAQMTARYFTRNTQLVVYVLWEEGAGLESCPMVVKTDVHSNKIYFIHRKEEVVA